MYLVIAFFIFLSLLIVFALMLEFSKIDNEITLSWSFNWIPLIPLEDLPLNNLSFLDLNLIPLPNWVLNIISWSSLQILTPIILSLSSNFIAILPFILILLKSSNVFFLTFPLDVAKITIIFFHSASSSGSGIIELIEWWLLSGNKLKIDFPLEADVPSGILWALILYAKPWVEKNKTGVWVLAVNICTTKSSSLVDMPDFPLPPLFCAFKALNGLLLIYPWFVILITTDSFWIVSSIL